MTLITLRPHPAAFLNRGMERRWRLVLLSIFTGGFISALAAITFHAVSVRGIHSLLDLALLFPLGFFFLFVGGALWHGILSSRPRIRLEAERITLQNRGINPFTAETVSLSVDSITRVALYRQPFGIQLVLFGKKNRLLRIPLACRDIHPVLDWVLRLTAANNTAVRKELNQLRDGFLTPDAFRLATPESRRQFSFCYSLPYLYRSLCAQKPGLNPSDLEQYYEMSRLVLDFMRLQEVASDYVLYLPEYALPAEDLFRISCVLRMKKEVERTFDHLLELKSGCEISPELRTRWKEHLKYRDLPSPPYSGIGARLLSGLSHYARILPSGMIQTHEKQTDPAQYIAMRRTEKWLGTSPLEVIDLFGRTMRINQDEHETLIRLRILFPHIMFIHPASYIEIQDRIIYKKIKKSFKITTDI